MAAASLQAFVNGTGGHDMRLPCLPVISGVDYCLVGTARRNECEGEAAVSSAGSPSHDRSWKENLQGERAFRGRHD